MTTSVARGLCSYLNVLLVKPAQSRAAVCFAMVPQLALASCACNSATELEACMLKHFGGVFDGRQPNEGRARALCRLIKIPLDRKPCN